jgi:hemerythrin
MEGQPTIKIGHLATTPARRQCLESLLTVRRRPWPEISVFSGPSINGAYPLWVCVMVGHSTRPLQWSEEFAVGHAGLDAQHRRLVEIVNDIEAAVHSKKKPERLADLLKVLRKATDEHIKQENALLWEIKSGTYGPLKDRPRTPHFLRAMAEAAFDEHTAEHATLLVHFDAICSAPVDELCEALRAWLVVHAIKCDSRLKAIFQAM